MATTTSLALSRLPLPCRRGRGWRRPTKPTASIVVVFARLGLYDRSQALALPEGTVRALIARVLLIIFVIFANIVFGTFTTSGRIAQEFSGLTSEQVANLPGAVLKQVPQGAAGTASRNIFG